MDPLEILSRLDVDADSVTLEELTTAQTDLRDLIGQATDPDGEPDIELAKELQAALAKISEVLAARSEAAEAARAEAAEIRTQAGISDDPDEDEDDDEDEPAENADEQVPVAASTGSEILARLRAVVSERPAPPEPPRTEPDVTVRGVGPASSSEADATYDSIADVFTSYGSQTGRSPQTLVQIRKHFTPDRILGKEAPENTAKLDAVASPRPMTASGGICGPGDVDHSVGVCADRGRPIRDGLVSFMASRGTVRFQPWPTLGDLSDAVAVWTAANDENPVSPAVKPCPAVECPEEDDCTVDAVTACLTVGNFQAKFNPEFWAAQLELLMIEHDRLAEQTLLATIDAGSTNAATISGNGTASNLAQTLDRWTNYYRQNLRISSPLTVILPETIRAAMRSDLAFAEDQGDYAAASATLASFMTARGVTPIWTPDDTTADNGTPGAFAATATIRMFPTGSWVFLDGGTIDLGTNITDSVLNSTNDRQAFMETFEAACHRGCETLEGDITIEDVCGCAA
jgi:hypothetical protein